VGGLAGGRGAGAIGPNFAKERRPSFDPRMVLKSGATLVRQWRGHTQRVGANHDPGSRFAGDSPLEGDEFEPSVPRCARTADSAAVV